MGVSAAESKNAQAPRIQPPDEGLQLSKSVWSSPVGMSHMPIWKLIGHSSLDITSSARVPCFRPFPSSASVTRVFCLNHSPRPIFRICYKNNALPFPLRLSKHITDMIGFSPVRQINITLPVLQGRKLGHRKAK